MIPNYAIDVHGTLAVRVQDGVAPSRLFPLLTGLMRVWVQSGSTVCILSGPTRDTIQREIDSLGLVEGVHYTGIFSMVDFLRAEGESLWEDPVGSNQWWTSRDVWNGAKGRIAEVYHLNVVVDDTEAYRAAMPYTTTFILVSCSG